MSREIFPRRPRRRVIFALASSPALLRGGFGFWFWSGFLSHELGSLREVAGVIFFFHPLGFIFLFGSTATCFGPDKSHGCLLPTQAPSGASCVMGSSVVR